MWTDLVQAYESKIAVLEEARRAYASAIRDVTDHVAQALDQGVRKGLEQSGEDYSAELVVGTAGDDAVFVSAPFADVYVADVSSDTKFGIGAWVASTLGGPAGVLHVVLSLETVRSGLDRGEWASRCAGTIPETGPGELFDPLASDRFIDIGTGRPIVRVASIPLPGRDVREVAREAHDMARSFTDCITPMFETIGDAGLPMTSAEHALLSYRPVLEARAAQSNAHMLPARGLGLWQGGKYLQVGDFWLCAYPASNELVAASNEGDSEVVAALASRLGRPVGRHGSCPSVVVLTEEQLRDPDGDVEAVVSEAFELWFETKSIWDGEIEGDGSSDSVAT